MLLTFLLVACDDTAKVVAAPRSRTDAVLAAPTKAVPVTDFCEQHPAPDQARVFSLPTLDGPPMANETGWTWVNVWATWCKPCIEEMPMLARWQARLAKEGTQVALQFLSVDAKPDDLAKYLAAHPEAPPTMHMAKIEDLAGWLGSIGLDATAVLPIHLFVDDEDRVRCVRMGSVGEPEYEVVKRVLRGE